MRILQLTPGAGNFYCGNCMRDNALVTALRARGHDVLMVPLYLPLLTDEREASEYTPIFFGGVNVYLEQSFDLFRRTPRWIDRIFNASLFLRLAGRLAGMTRAGGLGPLTLSMLRGEHGNQVKEIEKLVEWLRLRLKPDVICLSNLLLVGLVRTLKEEFRLPVVCTLQGEDSFLDGLPEPWRSDAWNEVRARSVEIDAFVGVSRYYADTIRQRLALPVDRVHVAYNGINLDGFASAPRPPAVPTIGYLARMCPQKGLHSLVEAFIELKHREKTRQVRLRIAGAQTSADRSYVNESRRKLVSQHLLADVDWLPNLDRAHKQEYLRSLSVLSVPALYGESFGLYLAEAWASGVPVVQPRHAAFPELVEMTKGGLLYEPDRPHALADALETLLLDTAKARQLGESGRTVAAREFSAERMAENVSRVFERVVGPPMATMTA